jgi:putative aldouronate transport system substrate-binding protein
MFINKQWLDRVGKKVPTTWEELKDVLIAFRDQDANGNGNKSDEIPMDFTPMGDGFSPHNLLGSLGLPVSNGGGGGYFAENGQVKNYFVDDRFRTLVVFLRDLYAEGLINRESVTQDYSQFQSLARGSGDVARVGFTFGFEPGDRVGEQLMSQYISVPPLKHTASYSGPVYYSSDSQVQNFAANKLSMSAKNKNKEASMKFFDLFYDPVTSIQAYWGGIRDGNITANADGSYTVMPTAGWANGFMDNGAFYIADYLNITNGNSEAIAETRLPYLEQLKLYDSKTNLYPTGDFLKYNDSDIQTLALNQANIDNLTSRWAIWMVGQGNIESDWNGYVQSVLNSGLRQNLEIRQKVYGEYVKKL